MAFYKILYWQTIPSQIKVWDDFDELSIELPQKYAARIDLSAQKQNLSKTDDFLAQWIWGDEQERDGSLQEVADAVQKELEENNS